VVEHDPCISAPWEKKKRGALLTFPFPAFGAKRGKGKKKKWGKKKKERREREKSVASSLVWQPFLRRPGQKKEKIGRKEKGGRSIRLGTFSDGLSH